jgi:hypothetical protein
MYRKIIVTGLLTASTATLAGPYVGVGYQAGASRVEQDSLKNPVVDGRPLDQSGSESSGGGRLLAGYRFNDRWALELSLEQPSLETSIEEPVGSTGDDEEWESSIDASHIALAPVYQHRLAERFELRLSAGVLYGDYDLERSHWIDVDNGPDQLVFSEKDSKSEVGGMVGVGAAWQTPWKFDVLGEVIHQRTSVLSNTGFALSAVYRF